MNAFWAEARMGCLVVAACAWLVPASGASAGDLSRALEIIMQGNKASARSQKKIDKIADQTGDMLSQFRTVQQQIESLRVYNAQVEKLVNSQREEVAGLEGKIENATAISREIMPLMIRMVDALDAFIALDIPFQIKERKDRVAGLRTMLDRADVTDSEKFRRLLEAYQIEIDFGKTSEDYKEDLVTNGTKRKVDFLRIGRIALLYMTLDAAEVGMWDKDAKAFVKISNEYRSAIKKGFKIARKQTAPDLIRLPIHIPEEAQ